MTYLSLKYLVFLRIVQSICFYLSIFSTVPILLHSPSSRSCFLYVTVANKNDSYLMYPVLISLISNTQTICQRWHMNTKKHTLPNSKNKDDISDVFQSALECWAVSHARVTNTNLEEARFQSAVRQTYLKITKETIFIVRDQQCWEILYKHANWFEFAWANTLTLRRENKPEDNEEGRPQWQKRVGSGPHLAQTTSSWPPTSERAFPRAEAWALKDYTKASTHGHCLAPQSHGGCLGQRGSKGRKVTMVRRKNGGKFKQK